MSITLDRVKVSNFKSFNTLDLQLGRFNVIVGQNASGKSNFGNIFSFLRDIADVGMDKAIHINGGPNYLLNFDSKDSVLSMEFGFKINAPGRMDSSRPCRFCKFLPSGITYKFSVKFLGSDYEIIIDELAIHDKPKGSAKPKTVVFSKTKDGISIGPLQYLEKLPGRIDEIINSVPPSGKRLVLESPLIEFLVPELYHFVLHMGMYDFEPKLLGLPAPKSPSRLSRDGSNLSSVIHHARKNPARTRLLENYARDLLPYFDIMGTGRAADGPPKMQETCGQGHFPVSFASDGTASILGLITCLFMQDNEMTFIKEPERGIHSALLPRIAQLMDEASENNQIFITTHNADMLDYVDSDSVLVMARNEHGSEITKLAEHENVKLFQDVMLKSRIMHKNLLR